MVVGVLVAVFSGSTLFGLSVALAFWLSGLLWRENELPVLVFCILYQWMFVITGYVSLLYYGYHPSRIAFGEIENAVLLSLIGLASIAVGIRVALPSDRSLRYRDMEIAGSGHVAYDPKKLFWIVIALFSINWLVETFPMAILFNAAQAIHSIFFV